MPLTIFTDVAAPPAALQLLHEGVGQHSLLLARNRGTSVLEKAPSDPQLDLADIAFGQPDPEALLRTERLRWLQVSSSSITRYDNADIRNWAAERGVIVCNSASVYAEACAEHALSFMLAQARLLPRSLATRAAGGTDVWQRLRGESVPLRGQSSVIVGFGAIGKRLVELLEPFGMNLVAVRRRARGDETIPVVTLERVEAGLWQAFDHVIDILPDSTETQHFFDARRLTALKRGSAFYNIGRGSTVDQEALLAALNSGQLGAAWLDVTDPEPLPPGHRLLEAPNCFITPHVAGGHRDESMTLIRHFLSNLERFDRGEPLRDRVL
jgi:phosphoglycerate dehydrogenase-like enzyme